MLTWGKDKKDNQDCGDTVSRAWHAETSHFTHCCLLFDEDDGLAFADFSSDGRHVKATPHIVRYMYWLSPEVHPESSYCKEIPLLGIPKLGFSETPASMPLFSYDGVLLLCLLS